MRKRGAFCESRADQCEANVTGFLGEGRSSPINDKETRRRARCGESGRTEPHETTREAE